MLTYSNILTGTSWCTNFCFQRWKHSETLSAGSDALTHICLLSPPPPCVLTYFFYPSSFLLPLFLVPFPPPPLPLPSSALHPSLAMTLGGGQGVMVSSEGQGEENRSILASFYPSQTCVQVHVQYSE